MSEDVFYRCYYTKEYPVDEFGRPGGFYSLADLPIAGKKELVREGILNAKNEENQMYRVRDVKNKLIGEVWVPMTDVEIGDEYVASETKN